MNSKTADLTTFLIVTVMKLMKEKAYPSKTIIIQGKVLKYYDNYVRFPNAYMQKAKVDL